MLRFKKKMSGLEQAQWEQNAILMQIYGELNRIRMTLADKKYGQRIIDFDKENNSYDPFFDSEEAFERYKAVKRKK